MEEHDSPEAVAKRASQEDPVVMYLIVRESLDMSIGKTAAQCAHASQMLTIIFYEKFHLLKDHPTAPISREKLNIFEDWLNSSFRKVTLKADEKEWVKLKEEFKDSMVLVVDAGLTELEPGTETVIGLWPMLKSQRSKLIKRLQALR